MKNIVKKDDKYLVLKSYENDKGVIYSRVIYESTSLERAYEKMKEDAVPVNNVGGGHIAGMDQGIAQKKSLFNMAKAALARRKKPRFK